MSDIALKAGSLEMLYKDGFIRYVKLGDVEIIRMINHSVRDQNWGTVPMQISDEVISIKDDSFRLSYSATFKKSPVDFELYCEIEGREDGSLIFTYNGVAHNDFKRNRIGFTVLHPIQHCKGSKVEIVHPDGTSSESLFPEWITPHQPFMNVREMHWSPLEGVKGSLLFEGEVFETEDQRNWTDASFKTYGTPLELPFPVTVKKGEKINQKITLSVSSSNESAFLSSRDLPVKITFRDEEFHLPPMGIVQNRPVDSAIRNQAIMDLAPDYLRIDLELDHKTEYALDLLQSAVQTGIPVELSIFTDKDDPIPDLEALQPYFGTVESVLLFGDSTKTTPNKLLKVIPKIKDLFPQRDIYAGTDAYFTELNREPVDIKNLDGVTYSINPQVHAFDDLSLIETLEAQAYTVESARNLFPGKKIKISPVSWHMRWNPNATDPDKKLRVPTDLSDPRQFSFFGACWFLISFKYLGESGVSGVTYFELTGDNGWAKTSDDSFFKTPVYAIREKLKNYNCIAPTKSSQPLLVDSIYLKNARESILMVVNWTDKKQPVSLDKAFRPVSYCRKWDDLNSRLVWKKIEGKEKSESFELRPNSISLFSG